MSNINGTKENYIENSIFDFLGRNKNYELFQEVYSQKGIGKCDYHKRDVLDHTKQTLVNFKTNLTYLDNQIYSILDLKIDDTKKSLLLDLSIVFHDAGKMPMLLKTGSMKGHAEYTINHQLQAIKERFGLTENQNEYVKNIIKYHDLPPENLNQDILLEIKNRGIYLEYLLLSLADLQSTLGPKVKLSAIRNRESFVIENVNKIISGYNNFKDIN